MKVVLVNLPIRAVHRNKNGKALKEKKEMDGVIENESNHERKR